MSYTIEQKQKLDTLVEQWLEIDNNKESRDEISQLKASGRYDVLDGKLSKRIAFGTAGLRSSMESGFAHMNDVTILQASQGLVKYLVAQNGTSIVIGYDHRFHSQRFAEITASVALSRGLKVYYLGATEQLSEESEPLQRNTEGIADRLYVHTPMVPFGIDYYHASAGVMVTASHNPAKDNGYKVYYGNGCQIIPPQDVEIAQSIAENLHPWEGSWDVQKRFTEGLASGCLIPVKTQLTAKYIEAVESKLIVNNKLSFDFVYTPMHGVGLEIFSHLLKKFGRVVDVVPEQANPDPLFPTVKFPNPEEAGALDLAITHAKEQGKRLVVASDPDADRFSVAIEKKNGEWKQLTGNEIGCLFAAYVLETTKLPDELKKTYLVNSTVSSQLLRAMAEKEGCHFQDTLTGFKWIGNKSLELKSEGFKVPFAYEEAIGYMFGVVNDKDGISAAVVWLQLFEKWFGGDVDAFEKLEQLYSRYGWHKECNGYYKLDDVRKTELIFAAVRGSYGGGRSFPERIGEFKVEEWRDLTVGFDSTTPNHVPTLPSDSSTQMITAVLQPLKGEGSVRFTCRGSGTEPKLKVYIEGRSSQNGEEASRIARECWKTLRGSWFDGYGLEEVV